MSNTAEVTVNVDVNWTLHAGDVVFFNDELHDVISKVRGLNEAYVVARDGHKTASRIAFTVVHSGTDCDCK